MTRETTWFFPYLKERCLLFTRRDYTTIVRRSCYHVVVFEKKFDWVDLARYWKDPYAFDPSRFLGDWPKDAFIAFSAGEFPHKRKVCSCWRLGIGARACLGRGYVFDIRLKTVIVRWSRFLSNRFFEVTGVAFITLLVSRYKFEVLEEPRFAEETFEEKRARVTHMQERLTTT
jgi:hypothetical protein